MDGIFKTPTTVNEKTGKKRAKTKAEMDEDEYKKVCERMKTLRDNRIANIKKKKEEGAKPPEPIIKEVEKIVEKEVIREVPVDRIVEKIVEKPVDRIVEKIVEKPVDRIVEKIVEKEVPASRPLLGDDDDIRSELRSLKKMLHEMRPSKEEASKPIDIPKPAPQQKYVFGGVYGGFKPF